MIEEEDPVGILRNRLKGMFTPDIYYTSEGSTHGQPEASVLILLAKRDNDWQVFLTLRSEKLRSYAGEVSFPGGKRDPNDTTVIETALREAEEETGLSPRNVEIIGVFKPMLSKRRILIYPVYAFLKEDFEPRINEDEVQKCFWLPLSHFLLKKYQMVVDLGTVKMHKFEFLEDIVYGITAHFCVITAMLVYDRYPEFPFIHYDFKEEDRGKSIVQLIQEHFDRESKNNLEFLLDLTEYSRKGKRGKM